MNHSDSDYAFFLEKLCFKRRIEIAMYITLKMDPVSSVKFKYSPTNVAISILTYVISRLFSVFFTLAKYYGKTLFFKQIKTQVRFCMNIYCKLNPFFVKLNKMILRNFLTIRIIAA